MGNSESTAPASAQASKASELSSSFGDPNKVFENKIKDWACKRKLPLTGDCHPYKIWTWKQGLFGHESIVIQAVNKDNDIDDSKKYGAFTIELRVNVSTKKVHLETAFIPYKMSDTMIELAKKNNQIKDCNYYISNEKWKPTETLSTIIWGTQTLSVQVSKVAKKNLIIETLSQNFIDIGLSLITHHGSYSLYCNNCQTFVNGFLTYLSKRFTNNRIRVSGMSDVEEATVLLGFSFFIVPAFVAMGVNSSIRASNGNDYNAVFNKIEMSEDQNAKTERLVKEHGLTQEMAVELLIEHGWQMEKVENELKK